VHFGVLLLPVQAEGEHAKVVIRLLFVFLYFVPALRDGTARERKF
jgi:hypothetical protein